MKRRKTTYQMHDHLPIDVLHMLDCENVAKWRLAYDQATDAFMRTERLLLPFTTAVSVRLSW